jgi:hypothetical protein
MELRNQQFKPEEDNYLVKLRNNGKSVSEIHLLYNDKYKTLRTKAAIESRIQKISRGSYSQLIDEVIVKHIRLNPANLQFAFKESCVELNSQNKTGISFTPMQVSGRYYSFIRKHYTVLTVGSDKGFTLNVKNCFSTKGKKQPKLSSVLFLLKEILNLEDKERKDLIEFLNQHN